MHLETLKLCLLVICCKFLIAATAIVNRNVERSIDLSSQIVKETIKVISDDDTGKPFKQYSIDICDELLSHLAHITVKSIAKKRLYLQEMSASGRKQFVINFPEAADSHSFYIELVYTNQIKPYPEQIKQSETQFVKYIGPLYFYSPYQTISQKIQYKLSTSNIISYTQIKPYNVMGNKIKYGPYENIPALSKEFTTLHYENQTPFMTANRLERTLQVSHWGNIAVEENILITHTGAKLKGSFSRYEFQRDSRSGQSAVKFYKTNLPASATEVYYRDTNGNISTSNMNILRDYVDLELRPRFPLFGGWKTQYTLGYNLPSFEYIFNNNDEYILKMRVIDHIFDDMIIENAVIKIVLPEGSTNIDLKVPYDVKRHENTMSYIYLDVFGRPTITFSKQNMVENHITEFILKYKFKKFLMLQEPLLITLFIFVIFLFTIIFKRLDFSISTHAHKE